MQTNTVSMYFVETVHGVLVDAVNHIKTARESAHHTGNKPRIGREVCKIYFNNAKGQKVYVS